MSAETNCLPHSWAPPLFRADSFRIIGGLIIHLYGATQYLLRPRETVLKLLHVEDRKSLTVLILFFRVLKKNHCSTDKKHWSQAYRVSVSVIAAIVPALLANCFFTVFLNVYKSSLLKSAQYWIKHLSSIVCEGKASLPPPQEALTPVCCMFGSAAVLYSCFTLQRKVMNSPCTANSIMLLYARKVPSRDVYVPSSLVIVDIVSINQLCWDLSELTACHLKYAWNTQEEGESLTVSSIRTICKELLKW